MSEKKEPLINLVFAEPYCVPVGEFQQISRAFTARFLAGATTAGDGILATLLKDALPRYYELSQGDKTALRP